ncbi:fructosamine kinase family protein [Cellulomonas flavigena]|uniref:fructosamine kinase family protein n=1 Tax=Cellulomonas flavigena TaxID=1711 RepID=UPI00066157E8|nr:fructosamine kinase family protein [Cellulomonas flavigena]
MDTIRKRDSRRGRIAYEVAGLAWLAEASDPGAAVVPVLDNGATWLKEPRLVSVPPTAEAAERFGRALAHTHAVGANHLGAPPPGFDGEGWMGEAPLSLPRDVTKASNGTMRQTESGVPSDAGHPGRAARGETAHDRAPASSQSWGAFYARERIAPYLDAPAFSTSDRALIERLCERLESGALDHGQPRLVADVIARPGPVGAARTHGDLWSGNVMWTPGGAVLIDPAAQGGHAEEDLAALAVFGCPHLERILAAYDEASAMVDGWRERVALHQMHIIMVHCVLFGRSYVPEAVSIARRYS